MLAQFSPQNDIVIKQKLLKIHFQNQLQRGIEKKMRKVPHYYRYREVSMLCPHCGFRTRYNRLLSRN
jgi:hypothetical protein